MKKIFLFSLLMLLFLMSGCSHQKGDDLDNPINKVQLTVNVVDALKQSPVKGAKVLIENLNRTAETREDGKAVFTVNQGELVISVSKNGYMANGSQKVRVDKNTSITLELAKEINETLSRNTTVISNGLYKLDFGGLSAQEKLDLEGVKLTLKNSGLSPSDLSKYVTEDTEIAGNIILLDLEDFQKATSNSNIAEVNVNIEFKVHNSISEDRVNYYDLMAISFYGENNYKVVPLYAIHKDGYYSANLPFRINETNIDKSYIFVYKIGSVDIDYNPTLEDAKKFVEDVKEHGINLTDAGKKQAEVISDNFNNNMVPYVMAIAKRFQEVEFDFDIFNILVDIGPGTYTLHLPDNLGSMYFSDYVYDLVKNFKEEHYEEYYEHYDEYETRKKTDPFIHNLSYDEYYWQVARGEEGNKYKNSKHYVCIENKLVDYVPAEKGEFFWDFTYEPYNVVISCSEFLVNDSEEVDIIEEDEKAITYIYTYTIDYRDIRFNFHKISKDDPDMEWLFKFKWEGSGDVRNEEIVWEYGYCEYDYETGEKICYKEIEKDVYIIPEGWKILVNGKAVDSKEYEDGKGNRLPSIGEITLDGLLDLFAENKDTVRFNGTLKADDELEFDGNLEIVFSQENTMVDVYTGEFWPELVSFMLDGMFETKDYTINGLCFIGFVDSEIKTNDGPMNFSLPENIVFRGLYENTTEDYFRLNGNLVIEVDYNDFIPDFSDDGKFETVDNYLKYTVNILGDLHARNYEPSALDLSCVRTGYREHKLNLAYFFSFGNYVKGEIVIDNDEDRIKAELENQDNLLLTFELEKGRKGKIGEIKNKLNQKDIFAEIKVDETTGEFSVVYRDLSSASLLP